MSSKLPLIASLLPLIDLIGGCATQYPHCGDDAACIEEMIEYDRVEYIETQIKPMVARCRYVGGFVYYYDNRKLGIALDTGDWSEVRKVDTIGLGCSK